MSEKDFSELSGLPNMAQLMPVMERVTEQIPGGFFIYRADETQEILYINRAALKIFGCETVEEFRTLTGGTFRGLVHPEDFSAIQASIDAQIADESNENMDAVEYRIIRKDGSVRWVDDYGHYAEFDGLGKVYYVFLSDITAKKEVQEENRLAARVIVGLSVDYACIYLLNLERGTMRTYHLKNDLFKGISGEIGMQKGMTSDWHAVLSKYAGLYIIPEDRELFLREIEESHIRERLASEDSFTVSYRCSMPDGGITYVSMSVSRTEDGEKNESVVLGFRDVTEDTLAFQKDLAAKMDTELALEREKHANEIKAQFLFNVSHDIRTPMNAIMGFVGLAKRHIAETDRLELYLDRVEEASSQLLSLIDDLLEMSKIEYGRIEIKAEPCDIREQLDLVMDLFKADAEEKSLALNTKLDIPDENVLLDATRFRRIIENLLSNAIKFTPPNGSITVAARQKQVSGSGYARYEFSVSDTGIGMSEDFLHRMYAAFEQERSSTEAGTSGAGLGLSIVKSLVDIMGGSISVESEKGRGTTFTIELPLKLASHAAARTEDVPKDTDCCAKGEHRILLVEDIEINRMLAETILVESGFLVDAVPDGCDAVEAVETHPAWYYDLILMDIQMPVMNGYEATRAIRAMNREDAKALPIIALSANARDEDKRMSMESGMNHHVAKPFDVVTLISAINEHIAAREAE